MGWIPRPLLLGLVRLAPEHLAWLASRVVAVAAVVAPEPVKELALARE